MNEDTEFALTLNMGIQQYDGGRFVGQGLEVRQHITLPPMGFLELAAVLGRFHDLAEQLKAEHAPAVTP